MTVTEPVVFSGPSLPDRPAAQRRLPGRYPGPAARGDLLRAALDRPAAIVLIDGYFERVPAVHHKEILWALDVGIPVYGAASLGALRAAELAPYGMIGVGAIFEGFATGRIVRDDEVALVHGPAETGFAALSDPLANIRATLRAAVEAGVLSPALHDAGLAQAEATFYPERTFDDLLATLAEAHGDELRQVRSWLDTGRVDQKNLDALTCLDRVAADLSNGSTPAAREFAFSHTDAFEQLLAEVTGGHGAAGSDESLLPELEALALRLDRVAHGPVPPSALAEQVTGFRERHDLSEPAALQTWLAARGTDIETLSRALESEARIARARLTVSDATEDRRTERAVTRGGGDTIL